MKKSEVEKFLTGCCISGSINAIGRAKCVTLKWNFRRRLNCRLLTNS